MRARHEGLTLGALEKRVMFCLEKTLCGVAVVLIVSGASAAGLVNAQTQASEPSASQPSESQASDQASVFACPMGGPMSGQGAGPQHRAAMSSGVAQMGDGGVMGRGAGMMSSSVGAGAIPNTSWRSAHAAMMANGHMPCQSATSASRSSAAGSSG